MYIHEFNNHQKYHLQSSKVLSKYFSKFQCFPLHFIIEICNKVIYVNMHKTSEYQFENPCLPLSLNPTRPNGLTMRVSEFSYQ